jgi:hypothetical protein
MTIAAAIGLDASQRTALERLVTGARSLLEADLAAQLEGRFGIHLDGTIEDEAALPDDTTDKIARRDLVQIVAHLRTVGEDPPGAVFRLLREAAFTHLNRLVAIRIAEAIGLLPESLAAGPRSRGFKDLGEIMPMLAGDYRAYVHLCGDELAADAPALFDPRNPLLALEPSTAAFDGLVALVADPGATEMWLAPDTLGWAYQFFNTGDERRAMREVSAPRNSRELAVRNQFFTPRYVVDFLVQNTIGRRLMEDDPTSPLLDELPLLVDPPTEPGPALDLNDVKCLDPACGSGHFLLGCYDVLERAWELAGVAPSESAPRIVTSLWGVDIDVRCAQVASAAIVLRARRHCRDLALPQPNIVTARGLPGGSSSLPADLELTSGQRSLIDRVSETLADAPLLGTLLRAEEALDEGIRHGVFGTAAGRGPDPLVLTDQAAEATEGELLGHLQAIADQVSSSAVERLLAAEADDALRFVRVVQQRYDAILMNPPYGLGSRATEEKLKKAYPDGWTDLYAAFLYRGQELLLEGGLLGALTSSQFFTTRKLRALRDLMIDRSRPLVIVDLGPGVLQGASVNTAMTVLRKARRTGSTVWLNSRDVPKDDRSAALASRPAVDWNRTSLELFRTVDGCPFAFNAISQVENWRSSSRLEPDLATVRTGNSTFDNFRFVRCRWEVDPTRINTQWVTYEKGGTYQPYFCPAHLVLDWKNDGENLRVEGERRGFLPQILQSSEHWYTPGLCYPVVNKALGVRIMPGGEIFAARAIAVLPKPDIDHAVLLGLLNSTPIAALLATFGRARYIDNGAVKALPVSRANVEDLTDDLVPRVMQLIQRFRDQEECDELSPVFRSLFADGDSLGEAQRSAAERRESARELQRQVDSAVQAVVAVPEQALEGMESRPNLVADALTAPDELADDWPERVISYLVGVAMGRWDCRVRGHSEQPELAQLFERLSQRPPGMLMLTSEMAQAEYPVQPPPHGVLVDEPGHAWDIEAAILRAASASPADADLIGGIEAGLGKKGLRTYLRKQFFKDHISRYSKSRRKAPIYWPLTVPSKTWGVWVYAPALTRETLYAVAGEAGRRERLAGEAITRLRNEQHQGGQARSARKVAEELDLEEKLAEELHVFGSEAERVAALGWDPDLDDGIILCAAPVADLFPSWPDAKATRTELRKGKYEWATVSAWSDRL